MKWRWNYGNGQVGNSRTRRADAERDGASNDAGGIGWLDFYYPGFADDPGDWIRARVSGGRA